MLKIEMQLPFISLDYLKEPIKQKLLCFNDLNSVIIENSVKLIFENFGCYGNNTLGVLN